MVDPVTPPVVAAKVALTAELLQRWARLEPFVHIGISKAPGPRVNLDEAEIDVVRSWVTLFREEIEAIRRARNFTRHLPAQFLPADELVEANEVASRLAAALADRLPRFREFLADETPVSVDRVDDATPRAPAAPTTPPPAATA